MAGQGRSESIPAGWRDGRWALLLCFAALQACDGCEEKSAPAANVAPAFPAPIPKIDAHTHIDPRATDLALRMFDDQGIATALNLSGGMPGAGLEQTMAAARTANGRIEVLCNLDFRRVEEPDFAAWATQMLEGCAAAGGKGLKVPKALGLAYRLADGSLLAVDDARLDVVFERAGALGLPVVIHTGDPLAFFEPSTPENERYAELSVHPEWSFADAERFPRFHALMDQLERRVARHPRTTFVGAHFGNDAEEPDRVGRMLDRHRNYFIDTAARVGEFGRHDAAKMKRFFVRYQDRILFGTDTGISLNGLMLGATSDRPPERKDVLHFFESHWRYFETTARGLAHPTPIQGNWTVDGIGLPRETLEKLYRVNASRVFKIPMPTTLAPH